MTLIVEDGTGKEDANTFATVDEADTYLSERGITSWATLQLPEKEAALIRAADYMVPPHCEWQGVRAVSSQALSWPRQYVYFEGVEIDIDVIPLKIKQAQIELAFRGAAGPLNPDIVPTSDDGRFITKKVERIGPIDEETSYATRGPLAGFQRPVWSAVLVMLKPFLRVNYGVYR